MNNIDHNFIRQIAQDIVKEFKSIINEDNELLSIKQVAHYFGKSHTSIRALLREDYSFPVPMKIGGEFKFFKKDIENYLQVKQKQGKSCFRPLLNRRSK